MLLTEFPDLSWLKTQIASNFHEQKTWTGEHLDQKGWPTVVLNVQSQHTVREDIQGTLSIFNNFSGESRIKTEEKEVILRPGQSFITNQDQHYSLYIDPLSSAETFNVHLGTNKIDEFMAQIAPSEVDLLEPINDQIRINFHNKIHELPNLQHLLQRLKWSYGCGNLYPLIQEELYAEIMQVMLLEEKLIRARMLEIPAVKKAVKIELGKRLINVVDYMYSHYSKEITLEALSEQAFLSKYHFLRLFKTYFGQSPHQFLTKIRINRAKDLLINTSNSIHQIAYAIGIQNPSSFTRLFNQKVGIGPNNFRLSHRK